MKLVCISDTHEGHHDLALPDGDVLVHAGDCTMRGTVPEVVDFLDWFREQPHPHKVLIAGNHDWCFYRHQIDLDWLAGIHYLQDSAVVIDGVRFYGSPWQPWFGGWAYNLERGAEIKAKWDLIPDDTDVLVTHGPPYGVRDKVFDRVWSCGGGRKQMIQVGCQDLLEAVQRVRPKVHIFGHIHEGHGAVPGPPTTFVNASIGYRMDLRKPPIEVSL